LAWQFSDPDGEFTNCSPGVSGSLVGVGDPFLFAMRCAPAWRANAAVTIIG
jgi:hypothetical protein